MTRIKGTLLEDQHTILITSRSVLRMKNFSFKICEENQKTHFVFSNFCVWKIATLCDNVEKYCTYGQTIDDSVAHGKLGT
jgi:hypothetical protein